MLMRGIVALACAAASMAAQADTTAVYSSRSKSFDLSMTVEIADSGNVRYQMSKGRTYGLVLDGVDYFVQLDAKEPIVDRLNDLVSAQKEAMAAHISAFKLHDTPAGPELVPIGNVAVNGRNGRAFGYKAEKPVAKPNPVVVISDDPDLAQLGKVMAKQFSKS